MPSPGNARTIIVGDGVHDIPLFVPPNRRLTAAALEIVGAHTQVRPYIRKRTADLFVGSGRVSGPYGKRRGAVVKYRAQNTKKQPFRTAFVVIQ